MRSILSLALHRFREYICEQSNLHLERIHLRTVEFDEVFSTISLRKCVELFRFDKS